MPIITVNVASIDDLAAGVEKAAADLEPAVHDDIFSIGEKVLNKAGELSAELEKVRKTLRLKMIGKMKALITAGDEKTPTAYMFEIGKTAAGNVWNHPVFPGTNSGEVRANWHWVKMTRPRRPYLTPAIVDVGLPAIDGLGDEIVTTINKTLGAK